MMHLLEIAAAAFLRANQIDQSLLHDECVEMCTIEIDGYREDFANEGEDWLNQIMEEKSSFSPFKYDPEKVPLSLRREGDTDNVAERIDTVLSWLMSDFERSAEVTE